VTVTEAARQPVVFDPYDYALHEDPYPVYARLRSEAPLYHNAHYDMERLWSPAVAIDSNRWQMLKAGMR
jgi:hypothetical protein